MATLDLLLAQSGFMLVSPWKPFLLLITLAGWAWVISNVYDKHAARFYLAQTAWNIGHLTAGLLALAVALLLPWKHEAAFWVGWLLMIVILVADLAAYAFSANRDERVPAEHRISLGVIAKMLAASRERRKGKQDAQVKLVIRFPDKSVLPVPAAESPELVTRIAAEDMFLKALAARASQVEITPAGKDGSYVARQMVDGVGQNTETFAAPTAAKLIDFWKSSAKLDVADRRRKLVGEANVEFGAGKTKLRVTSVGVTGGMRLTLLVEPEKAVRRKLEQLGLLPEQMAELKAIADGPRGVTLLAGQADTGRTTTFYSVMQLHDAYTGTLQTIETEPQLALEGIRHTLFDPTAEGADYATSVRSLLRRDPDLLSVAELPDATTAKEIAKADLERTRIYISVRADNALQAVEGYVKAVGDNELAAKGLRGVLCQKILRKLCTNCRVSYPPTTDMLKKMGVPATEKVQQLFKKGGQVLIKNKPETCPVCGGGGYVGQEAIFEVYSIDEAGRAALQEGNLTALKAEWRKRNLPSIQQAAIRKAIAGITSVDEVTRVMSPPAAPAAVPAAPRKSE